jgi:Linalool dehydratase/isomerase
MHLTHAPSLELLERPARGPVTRRRLRRFLTGLAIVAVAAALVAVTTESRALRAFALGVLVPGGGFVYGTPNIVLAAIGVVVSLIALLVALMWWTLFGNILAPPAVIVGSAALSAFTTGGSVRDGALAVVLVVFALLVGAALVLDSVRQRTARHRGKQRNTYLADIPAPAPRSPDFRVSELSEQDLAHQRWLLHLALQPVDRFDGFDRLDQFSFSALRYQLNFTQYALAMAQRHHTPAFQGYVSAAQRNLIEKMLEPRVWRYWRLENLWGNLDPNPDPVRRDNIMFSGYFALMLSLYRNASGDSRYDAPGSLVFRTGGGREFSYDHPTILRIVARQFTDEASGMWPCEPGFAYPMCNALGASGVLGGQGYYDSRNGELAPGMLASVQKGLAEEYTYPDGSIAHVRSTRFGFAPPGVGSGAIMGAWQRANLPLLMRPVDPVAAQRLWEILRHEDAKLVDGTFTLPRLTMSDKRDIGNLGASMANFWSCLYADAREFGDARIASAVHQVAEESLEPQVRAGARAYAKASVYSNAIFNLGRFIDEHGYTDAVTAPPPAAWLRGPVLADAPYPECLVARAETDGTALSLVLRPGEGPCRVRLSLARLQPGARYSARGASPDQVTAEPDGTALLEVELGGRTEVQLTRLP